MDLLWALTFSGNCGDFAAPGVPYMGLGQRMRAIIFDGSVNSVKPNWA